MPGTIDLTETLILAALRTVLIGFVLPGTEVIRTEINRVPEPKTATFVTMTPTKRERLASDVVTYDPDRDVMLILQATQLTVSLDIHGPNSADNAQIISTLFRDDAACVAFDALGLAIQPLFAGEPGQSAFMNAAQQIEWRWTIDVDLQVNPVITLAQQFATELVVDLIEVDTTYPPGAA